jgi:hypothetical protein
MLLNILFIGSIIVSWIYGLFLWLYCFYKLYVKNPFWLLSYIFLLKFADYIHKMPFFGFFQNLVRTQVQKYFKLEYLTPSVFVSKKDWIKPQIIISGPHGLFSFAIARSITDKINNCIFGIDNTLTYNPLITMFLKFGGLNGVLGLKHKKIIKELSNKKQDILVIPGGFVEASSCSETCNTMYSKQWSYWILQAIKNNYDVSFMWVYGGTQTYHQGSFFSKFRTFFAKRNIPMIFPFGRFFSFIPYNDVPFSVVSFRKTYPHNPNAKLEDIQNEISDFHTCVFELMIKYPPKEYHAPIKHIQ